MVYGPFHNMRCKDTIAAAMLDNHTDESDGNRRPLVAGSNDRPSDSEDERDSDGQPSFLSDDDADTTILTGPADDSKTE